MADRKFRIVGGTTAGDGGSNPVDPTEPKEMTSAMQGGSDGGSGVSDLEPRVKRLEDDGKEIRADLKSIMRDLAEIKGSVATNKELGDLRVAVAKVETRIDKLPTTTRVSAYFAFAIIIVTILSKWGEIFNYFSPK